MIWDIENEKDRNDPSVAGTKVVAADGTVIDFIVWMDTETGFVKKHRRSPDGKDFAFHLDNYGRIAGIVVDTVQYPAPLSIVPNEAPA